MRYTLFHDRSLLAVTGKDSRHFLQGIITNDIHKVTVQKASYALVLTPQGKYLHDLFISEHDGALLLEVASARLPELLRKLTLYKLRSDVAFTDVTCHYAITALQGEGVFAATALPEQEGAATTFLHGKAYVDPRTARLGVRAFLPQARADALLQAAGFIRDDSAYDAARIRACVPEGEKDLLPEKAFPLEYGLEALNAIDFKKGCYVGQEVTARTTYRGTVRKRIYHITGDGILPTHGTEIMAGEQKIGIVCSHQGTDGLALLRTEALEAASTATFDAGGIAVRVVA